MSNNNNENPKQSLGERVKSAPRSKWIKFLLMSVFIVLFVFWTGYLGLLLFILVFFDSYILKYIPWSFWKKSKNKTFRAVMEWVDAISFAIVAAYIINTFFFQNYQIPSSSLEKSLLVGDFLLVSKMSYGTRSPMTPLSLPLVQHTLPFFNTKSYFENPKVDYQRFSGFGSIERGDIVVFNFPAGDTVAVNRQEVDYYSLCKLDPNGREGLWNKKAEYGDIIYRPVDRKENYVKRCIGLPGDTLKIVEDQVYINGQKINDPLDMQLNYYVQTDGTEISEKVFDELGISKDDYMTTNQLGQQVPYYIDPLRQIQQNNILDNAINPDAIFTRDSLFLTQLGFKAKDKSFGKAYLLPLTKDMIKSFEEKPFVLSIVKEKERVERYDVGNNKVINYPFYYPINYNTGWTRDNYGSLWIPKKGATIKFDENVDYKVAAYERAIKNYEGNDFEYKDGKVYINGKEADSYTFKMDYYFMMGDNRDKSADSRSWGFVPEDHVVGKPLFVWLSLNKDKGWFDGKIRWNRIFTSAKKK